jgi:hypothetical protein
MPRPKNKSELLLQAEINYQNLLQYIEKLDPEMLSVPFPECYMNRNIKDVLFHVHHWHLMFQRWYTEGSTGMKPAIPAQGYTWKETPALNRSIWRTYKNDRHEVARILLEESHREVMKIIENHSEEDLFTKKKYKWTGTTSLAAYLISATSSHYVWALKLIKKCHRELSVLTI